MDFIPSNRSLTQAQLLARLAAERTHLLLQFEGEDEAALTSPQPANCSPTPFRTGSRPRIKPKPDKMLATAQPRSIAVRCF